MSSSLPQRQTPVRRRRARWSWSWLWAGEYLGIRGAMLLLLSVFAVVGGVWVLTRHQAPAPESMSSGTRPRLPDGTIASGPSLSVAEAIARQLTHPVAIHGYIEAAADDRPYLCARLNGYPIAEANRTL
jgi:hypothetical protein